MTKTIHLSGLQNGVRVESRILEEQIQQAVNQGARVLEIEALGQHGIGGRLPVSEQEPVHITITGSSGQRTGSMGFPGTFIDILGPASDDIGWLNAGAEITVRGNASNGAANGMAQGRIFVDGSIGARGMTMTKRNPRFDPPELWIKGSAGDYFAEFMAGGIAVVCGIDAQTPDNVLGYRPCVGMVGGKIYFRGPIQGFSEADAKLVPMDDENWDWLSANIAIFADRIDRPEIIEQLTDRDEWQIIEARLPFEKIEKRHLSMAEFHSNVWDRELGRGGLVGDLTDLDRSPVPLIPTDNLRRFVPVWENHKYLPPCQASCPTGIPVQKRWQLIREGNLEQAIDMALRYTPFPATVCGYLCPNLCMQNCTRQIQRMSPIDVHVLGQKSIEARMPELPPRTDKKIAVIGGGPAGISVAWQLRLAGHNVTVFDRETTLGGKITSAIPESRIPQKVLEAELARVRDVIEHVQLQEDMSAEKFAELKSDFDFVVVASGASSPRTLPVPGKEHLITALDFLKKAKAGTIHPGRQVVIIGAGNVGCDVATEAGRLGCRDITLIDIQEPASFGKEREEAEKYGARFKFPCFTREITDKGVVLTTGELVPADMVIVSIGDQPELSFLPETVATERGWITVNDVFQTTDPKVFAIGDIVKPGLITDAIGAGRRAALAIDAMLTGKRPTGDPATMLEHTATSLEYIQRDGEQSEMIDYSRMTLEYFNPRVTKFESLDRCAEECSSCGSCRDCGLCEAICPQTAISRKALENGEFEMRSDPKRCIGCGFCADACPCGIWTLVPNTPMG
jgi:NADPH-dependent glutamate synthase beta subunit-like oxidoreductase/glutamate synthase domain-containing protein 3/ferredoxin